MYKAFAIGMSLLLLAGCASTVPDGSPAASRPAAEAGATLASLDYMQDVDVSELPTDDETHCRMVAPTGSRIAVERCYIESDALEQRRHALTREQFEALRDQQMHLDAVRRQASDKAAREFMYRDARGRVQ